MRLTKAKLREYEKEIDLISAELDWLNPKWEADKIQTHELRLAELQQLIELSVVEGRPKPKLPSNVISLEVARLKFGTRTHDQFTKPQLLTSEFSAESKKKIEEDRVRSNNRILKSI